MTTCHGTDRVVSGMMLLVGEREEEAGAALIVTLRSAIGRFTRTRRAIVGGNRFASMRFVLELLLFLNREAVPPHSPGSAVVTPRHPG